MESGSHSTYLQACLDEYRAGKSEAAAALLDHAYNRLRRLARKMLGNNIALKRWEDTDDVLQQAALRLHNAVRKVKPATVREFFGLAALQMRRVLIDLARRHFGAAGIAARRDAQSSDTSIVRNTAAGDTEDPAHLEQWAELHERIGQLSDELREVFDLVWYHDLSQAEAAVVLETSERTVRRRWRAARVALGEMLESSLPID